jgi:hypothetical protein
MTTTTCEPDPPRAHEPEPQLAPEVKKAVIEQLAKEIQAAADSVLSLRTRTAFTIWIGPYVVLGSIVVATKGGFTLDVHSRLFPIGLVIAVGCYLVLGYLAGRIERFSLERSNQWRKCIIAVAETGTVDPTLYLDKVLPTLIVRSYLLVFVVLLACFFGVATLVSTIQPRPEVSQTRSVTPDQQQIRSATPDRK